MPGFFNKPDSSNKNSDNQVQIKKDIYKPKFSHNDELGSKKTRGTGETTSITTVDFGVLPSTTTSTTTIGTTTTTSSTTTTTTLHIRQSGEFSLQNDSSYFIEKFYDAGTTGNITFTASISPNTTDTVVLSATGSDTIGYSILTSGTYSTAIGSSSFNNNFFNSGDPILAGFTAQQSDQVYQIYGTTTFIVGNEIPAMQPIATITIINNSSYTLNIYDERVSINSNIVLQMDKRLHTVDMKTLT